AGGMGKLSFGGFAVVLDRADPAAVGQTDGDRELLGAAEARVHFGQLRDDLVEGRVDETVELDFSHRAEPGLGQSNRSTNNAGFAQGRIDHATRAEAGGEAFGDAVDPTECADVFALEQHRVVGGEFISKSSVDCLPDGEFLSAG